MLDPKLLRESPDLVRAAIQKKHLEVDIDAVLSVDAAWRSRLHDVETLRSRQKAANNEMVALKKGSPEFIAKVGEMKAVSAEVKQREAELAEIETAWRQAMLSLPNLPHSSVPEGRTPEQNAVFSSHGNIDALSPVAKAHWEIPGFDHLFDFGRGAKVTGAGFPFYVGDGARLVRALLNFFLEEAAAAGYLEVSPPILVNAASATATGQLPDKEGQMYETAVDHLYAVPTAEVPLTNFFRDEILAEESLPVHRCAYTPCFRREAGSYGKDVRGLNRSSDLACPSRGTDTGSAPDAPETPRSSNNSIPPTSASGPPPTLPNRISWPAQTPDHHRTSEGRGRGARACGANAPHRRATDRVPRSSATDAPI